MKRWTFMQAGGEEETCPTNSQKATREPQASSPDTIKKLAHVCICLNSNCMIHAGMRVGGVLVERLTLCHLFRLQRRSALTRFT